MSRPKSLCHDAANSPRPDDARRAPARRCPPSPSSAPHRPGRRSPRRCAPWTDTSTPPLPNPFEIVEVATLLGNARADRRRSAELSCPSRGGRFVRTEMTPPNASDPYAHRPGPRATSMPSTTDRIQEGRARSDAALRRHAAAIDQDQRPAARQAANGRHGRLSFRHLADARHVLHAPASGSPDSASRCRARTATSARRPAKRRCSARRRR